VALYFYPKDDTPGCTKQACNIRDNYSALTEKGIKLFGVSVDDEKSHQKFIHKFSLPFPLLADTEHDIVNSYKVWVEKNMYGKKYMGTARVTYLIDEKGIISHVIEKVDVENHSEQILKLIA
jgi:peroxiredoxin Q/BCP